MRVNMRGAVQTSSHRYEGKTPRRALGAASPRADGSIGVSPVSRNDGCRSANGSGAKFALQAFDHRPARQSGTQAGLLCYLGLGYVPDFHVARHSTKLLSLTAIYLLFRGQDTRPRMSGMIQTLCSRGSESYSVYH